MHWLIVISTVMAITVTTLLSLRPIETPDVEVAARQPLPTTTPVTLTPPTPTVETIELPTPTSTIIASPTPSITPQSSPIPTTTIKPTSTPTPVPPTQITTTQPEIQDNTYEDYQTNILEQINNYRQSLGIADARMNQQVCDFATLRAQEISQNFSHDGFTQRVSQNTFPYSGYSEVTENIAMSNDLNVVVSLWIESPTHAENMRKDTPFICVVRNGNYYAYAGWRP